MKILYYDCFAGISGDMNLAAMIGLGVEPGYLRAELAKLGLDQEFDLQVAADSRQGIHGVRVDVVLKGEASRHHCHGEDSPHGHGRGHAHLHAAHRNLADIEAIILASALAAEVKETSLAIFRRVAEAEARVHGQPLREVHFHEVGATDSIVDIVGAAICFHRLGVDAVWASPVELGGGFVRCAHGLIPAPAPATMEILQGIPTTRGAVPHEAATPTGAAILAALVDEFTATPALATEKTAYGIGHRDAAIPNVLRVHLARPAVALKSAARPRHGGTSDLTAGMAGSDQGAGPISPAEATSARYLELLRRLRALGKAAVAFSGGADSTFLLHAARQALADNVLAVTIVTPYMPAAEIAAARSMAEAMGARHLLLETSIPESIRLNPPDRCYLCKQNLFTQMQEAARREGIDHLVDGTNRDDLGDYRPGLKALAELGVVSPLLAAGLTKQDIRDLCRAHGLAVWDKPAGACLLTRLPHGRPVEVAELRRIDQGEEFLKGLGFTAVRLRSHGDVARIEVPCERVAEVVEVDRRHGIATHLKALGYRHVTVDLTGYRMGSLNVQAA